MPFALVTVGLLMIVSGSRDTYAAFGKELVSEFTGPGNFMFWIVAIGGVGALGYIPQLRTFSRAFMALIVIAMVIRNGGIFDKFSQALVNGPVRPGDSAIDITASVKSNIPEFDASDYKSDAAGNARAATDLAKELAKFFI